MMFCENCGKELPDTAKFCSNCGTPPGAPAPDQPDGEELLAVRASWTAWITPLRNMTAMMQLLMCFGVSILAVGLLCVIFSGEIALLWHVGGIMTAIFAPLIIVGSIIHWMFIGGKELYIITDRGVWRGPAKGAAKSLSGAFNAVAIAQLLSGNFSMAGGAMMAAARVQQDMTWSEVKEVSYRPGRRLIVLKESLLNKIWMFCTEENYARIAAMVKGYTGK